jgi:exopolysaccharide production protein ExoQ
VTTTLQQPATVTPNATHSELLLLPTLVGFGFAFRTCLTLLWFQDDPQTGTIVAVALSFTLLIAAVLSTIGGKPSLPSEYLRTATIRWAICFLLLALFSLLWTAAPIEAAAAYWAAWATDIATIWFVLREGVAEERADAIMYGFIWGAILVALIAWFIPPTDDQRLGNEDFLHPNALGFLFSIATFMASHLARKSKIWFWPALFLATTLLRTISKSAIVAFVAAFGFYLIRDSTLSRRIKTWITILAGIIVASLGGILEAYFTDYSSTAGPETLTGRTIIWALSFEYAIKKPILGNGIYAFRFIVPPLGEFQGQQAHDDLLQQFFAFGIVGVILTVGVYWAFFRQIRTTPPSPIKSLAGTILLFSLIRGLTDTQIVDLSLPLWLMTMLSLLLASETQKLQQQKIAIEL